MTRSMDRTLLARLGFGDSDRREPEHDQACRYVLQNAQKIVRAFWPRECHESCELTWSEHNGAAYIGRGALEHTITIVNSEQERVVSKGRDQFKTTIGFIDAFFSFRSEMILTGSRRTIPEQYIKNPEEIKRAFSQNVLWDQSICQTAGAWDTGLIMAYAAFEVKIKPTPISEAIRQIKLYRQYMIRTPSWFLVTRFPINQCDVNTLRQESISHIYLGEGFDVWMKSQTTEDSKGFEL